VGAAVKIDLNAGDWATIALFVLGMLLGCYTEPGRKLPARSGPSVATANRSASEATAAFR